MCCFDELTLDTRDQLYSHFCLSSNLFGFYCNDPDNISYIYVCLRLCTCYAVELVAIKQIFMVFFRTSDLGKDIISFNSLVCL